ncbi:hypothetical protein BDW67DRAFT_99333 [Aspergillus spinulosporus]
MHGISQSSTSLCMLMFPSWAAVHLQSSLCFRQLYTYANRSISLLWPANRCQNRFVKNKSILSSITILRLDAPDTGAKARPGEHAVFRTRYTCTTGQIPQDMFKAASNYSALIVQKQRVQSGVRPTRPISRQRAKL